MVSGILDSILSVIFLLLFSWRSKIFSVYSWLKILRFFSLFFRVCPKLGFLQPSGEEEHSFRILYDFYTELSERKFTRWELCVLRGEKKLLSSWISFHQIPVFLNFQGRHSRLTLVDYSHLPLDWGWAVPKSNSYMSIYIYRIETSRKCCLLLWPKMINL